MRFELLGPFRVVSDGREVALGGTKQRALLAMLALAPNQRVSRDRLMDGLWGDELPPSAEHTLDGYISRLRKAVGGERIERVSGGYRLHIGADELDLSAFDHLVQQGHMSLVGGDSWAAAESLAAALGLWRGDALADLLDEPFAGEAAAHLEERRLAVLEERIDADLRNGAGPQLVPELEVLVRNHPFRERLLAAQMLALYRAGRQSAALDVYRAAHRRFSEELGIEPGTRLRELELAILGHDPELEAPAMSDAHARPSRSGRTLPRRPVIAGVALALIAAALGLAIELNHHGSTSTPIAAGANLFRFGRLDRVSAAAAVPGVPASVEYGNGSVWVSDTAGNQLLRTDPQTGAVTDRIPLPAQPGEIAIGGGSVWVAATGGATIMRVDEETDGITQVIRLGASPAGLAFGSGSLWVGDPVDAAVLRIDPTSGTAVQTVNVGVQPAAIAVSQGRVWTAGYDTGTVVEFDPRTGSTIASVHVGQGPTDLAFASGSLWVANRLDGTVSEIDPRTATVLRTLPTGSSPVSLTASGDSVWVANEFSRTITRIDPARGIVRSRLQVSGSPVAIAHLAAGDPSVWVATVSAAKGRGGTLVLLDTRRFFSIDPQVDYEATPPGFLGLVNDTLVAFDHTTGPDGFQLVPDLALRLPPASDDGKTYVFQLRPDLHYSDGRAVHASDFGRSMVRLFSVGSPGASFFSAVVGSSACVRAPSACRLPGVVTDDSTRTVTFHLSVPDPDFLYKLALGFVVPIPPGTPMHEVRKRPIIGTGPYVFTSVSSKAFTFTRNPRFVEWSHAAQPDGIPDRIVWRFGLSPEQEIQTVAHGQADWTGDFPSDVASISRNYPSELHNNVFPTAYFAQLNTRIAPFNDVRVRRALNFAVDRAKIVQLSGGSILNAPLCQVIPPGLPGHRGYCPYSRHPVSSGAWTGPDMARATALVSASKTRGQAVSVWSISDSGSAEPAAPYLASVLRRLGYRARVRVVTTSELSAMPPPDVARMQLRFANFGPDYPSASEIYSVYFACAAGGFCDHDLDRRAAEAETLRADNPRASASAWAAIDRRLVDQAVSVPLATQRILDFVSPRLRNYLFSPVYHFLPAQASIREGAHR